MKTIKLFYYKTMVLMFAMFSSVLAIAQEKTMDVDIDVNKGGDDWYKQPWVWIVGALVFILVLVAILRGGKRD